MKMDSINDKFLAAIKEKIPQRTLLANSLVDILQIEKEAVYRRLRGEVSFTFSEVASISQTLGMSLDLLVGSISDRSRPFQLKLLQYINPQEIDYYMLNEFIQITKSCPDYSDTEFSTALNMLPSTLYMNHYHLFRFYLFKWVYQYESPTSSRYFKDIAPPEKMYELLKELPAIAQNATRTYYIWDELIFQYLVKDISYFTAINLISLEEKNLLRKELLNLLDEIETLAVKGHTRSGNKIYFYISNIVFETSYSYLEMPHCCICLVKAFTLNDIASLDMETFKRIKHWMQSLKRTSTLISESGEMYRIQFFEKQREIIDSL